jgi:hypothetical protein
MKVNPKVYYTSLGARTGDAVLNAVNRIFTNASSPTQHWERKSYTPATPTTPAKLVLGCKTVGNQNMWFELTAEAANCLGRLSVDGGSNWSPSSRMAGGYLSYNFNAGLSIDVSRLYAVEVEDAIFIYTYNAVVTKTNPFPSTIEPNNLCYSLAAGLLIQPYDLEDKGEAIFGGHPSNKGSLTFTGRSFDIGTKILESGWCTAMQESNIQCFARINSQWKKITYPLGPFNSMNYTYSATGLSHRAQGVSTTYLRYNFGDNASIQRFIGIQVLDYTTKGRIGSTKYARTSNSRFNSRAIPPITNSSIIASPSRNAVQGWKINLLVRGYALDNSYVIIWCSPGEEILIS